VIENGDAS
jgi:hypothetical protein